MDGWMEEGKERTMALRRGNARGLSNRGGRACTEEDRHGNGK